MSEMKELANMNWMLFLLSSFAVLFAAKEMIEIISYFRKKFRIKFGHEVDKETVEDRICRLEKHDKWQYDEITKIASGVEEISKQLDDMQHKMDETEMAKLKDTIVNYYKKYKEIGKWSKLESDAFWNLFKRYEAHGGNGYCHSIIEPAMQELDVID